MDLLNEVLDENTKTYPVINLKPKAKIPQVWKFEVPGNDSLMARLVSFQSDGDVVKAVKMGDKFSQVFLMSLSDKGNAGELRGGLGSDPMGAIATIFDTIAETAKKYRIDAVLFRLPIKKMKGQHVAVQRILTRLAATRTGGRYVVLKELWNHSKKYAYVLIHRKNVPLEDIPGIPEISSELFTSVETKAGNIYVDKKSGSTVTKAEALAITISDIEDNRTTDRAVAARTKISRRDAIRAQYGPQAGTDGFPAEIQNIHNKLIDTPPVHMSTEPPLKDVNQIIGSAYNAVEDDISKFYSPDPYKKNDSFLATGLKWNVNSMLTKTKAFSTPRTEKETRDLADKITNDHITVLSQYNGRNLMDVYRNSAAALMENFKDSPLPADVRRELIKLQLESITQLIGKAMANQYAIIGFADDYSNKQYTAEEKTAIKFYTLRGYSDINDFLIGADSSVKSVREQSIPALDSAFEKGQTLPKGTTLYRGQTVRTPLFNKSVKNKLFYFTNFVSTSMAPAIFGMYGNAYEAIDQRARVVDVDAEDNVEELVTYDDNLVKLGFVINGADKIKTIVPIGMTTYPEECEVILPRGTCLRINKIYANEENIPYRTVYSALFETTVMTPDQIDESEEIVYDGDVLMETGEVVPAQGFSFSDFVAKEEEKAEEEMESHVDEIMQIMLEIMDIDSIPEKFRI